MTEMEDSHRQKPPKFEDCTPQIFTLNQQTATHHHHHHYTPPPPRPLSQQPPPPPSYIFPQLPQSLAPGASQGFLQYNQPNCFRAIVLPPQGRVQESLPRGAPAGITSSVPRFSLTFKSDLDENIGKNGGFGGVGGGDGGEDGLLRGSEQQQQQQQPYVPDARRATHYGWQNQEDSATRQPFWKPLCTEIADNGINKGVNGINDKEVQQPEMNPSKYYGVCGGEEADQLQMNSLERRKDRLIGELEEICRNASAANANANANVGGDGSVENFAASTPAANAAAPAADTTGGGGGGGGGDGDGGAASRMDEEMKERRKMRDEMSSMAAFFEGLVRQLIEHQENLHRKFMAAIEKLDQERKARDQEWRQKELERIELEAALRANERALVSRREASIISCLEKITGQTIQLPSRNPTLDPQQGISSGLINELSSSNKGRGDSSLRMMNKRWPKAEVDALIQIRSNLEKRFQGPGYKGPLWDEISNVMASMGFQRTAKRCKEKWENINKYFKKSREKSNSKQSRKKLKTCQYFDQLDQLYSKSSGVVITGSNSNSSSSSSEQQADPSGGNGVLPAGNLTGEAGFSRIPPGFTGIANGNMEEEEEEEDDEEGDGGNDNDDLCS